MVPPVDTSGPRPLSERQIFPLRLMGLLNLHAELLALGGVAAWAVVAGYIVLKNPTVYLNDMFDFIQRAQALSLGSLASWVDGLYPFGYPLLLRGMFFFTHDYEAAGNIISLAAGMIGLWLVYRLATELFDPPVALLALAFCALNPIYLRYATTSGTDMAATAAILAALYALTLEAGAGSRRWLALGGLLLGLAYLLRYTALALVLGAALWVWLRARRARSASPAGRVLVLLGAFALGAGPQLVLSALAQHNPFYNQEARNVVFGMFGQWNWGLNWPATASATSLAQVVRAHPAAFAANWANNLFSFLQMDLAQFPLILFMFPGMLVALKRAPRAGRLWLLVLAYFAYGAVMALAFVDERLLLPCVPLAAVFAGYGFYRFVPELLPERGRLARYARFMAAPALLALMLAVYVRPLLSLTAYNRVKIQVSQTLNRSGLASSRQVLSFSFDYYNLKSPSEDRFAIESWYTTAFVPYRSVDDIAARMRASQERFLVFDAEAPKNVPGLAAIWPLDPAAMQRDFELLGQYAEGAQVWQLKS